MLKNNVILNNGVALPLVGSGTNTFGKDGHQYDAVINDDTTEIEQAIRSGYRHFDTAISYRNERVVALGISRSGLPRSEFFITSKLPGTPLYTQSDAAVHEGVALSLKNLDTSYIDLYLIHHPWDDNASIHQVWRVLESYVDSGVLKAIGVSNFSKEQLNYLLEHARIKPAVNQIESHPGFWNGELTAFCQEHGIVVEAWGPLSRVTQEHRDLLTTVGAKYGKTWAQVALRYQVQKGVVVIPKSHDTIRQAQNLELFDFELTASEMQMLSGLNTPR